ncbi:MAG: HAMP domain-containing histidine kinase [Solirubrobacterales bacterium]|nr:HAMP domain-containing histidine kinase [Solirubrobacterales bacterium]
MQAIKSALPSSLRWRLTLWVAGVMLVSAAAVFVVVYKDTGTQLRSQIDRDLTGDTDQLARSLTASPARTPAEITMAATTYMRVQPYTPTSTLMFVMIPGAPTASNHPEVFNGGGELGEHETRAQQARELSQERQLRVPRIGYSTQRVPDVGKVRIFERAVTVGAVQTIVGAGEPLTNVDRAQEGVAKAFVLAGAIVLVLAMLASYLAGARVSAPLRRMAGVATRVDAGDLAPRMETASGRADEVRVLADAFNHMLDRLADAFASQRGFVADASHELRTPLTVIRGQLEVLAAQENPSGEDVRRVERLVQAEITRVSRLVDDLLVLARAEQTDFLRPEWIDVRPFVDELWDGLSLTADRRFELGDVPEGYLHADPDRLAQALRDLASNSIEHTAEKTGLVRLEVEPLAPDKIRFAVLDDGPGIPVAERERVFERFHRTDPGRSRAVGGAGLGLAIVRAIAEAHAGDVHAVDPLDGIGARVELVLPGFEVTNLGGR